MDIARATHNAQSRLKQAMTPLWTKEMGHRLRIARMKQGRSQLEFAALLSTEAHPVSQQQIARVENGRMDRIGVTWARLEAVLGTQLSYVLIGAGAALYNERLIHRRYWDLRMKTDLHGGVRKRGKYDPKRGVT
jgi:transcriptional regulator with XRE-family HTH domain